ncbi:MAG: hypothetical protein C4306_11580 [Thermoleophilia bacterium]
MSGQLADVLGPIPPPVDRWDSAAAAGGSPLEELVYRSRLLGADRALANWGGGNTSAKGTSLDHTGREVATLWVKGSGTDLATITPAGFAALRLDEVLLLREREAMEDAEMVEYLRRCALFPDQPRPSIETLLHAFIPAAHVDHTHPDAVIALTSCPAGRRLAEEGERALWDALDAGGWRRRPSARRPCGSTTSAPASPCPSGSPSSSRASRERGRCSWRGMGSSPGEGRARRPTGARWRWSPAPPRPWPGRGRDDPSWAAKR